MIVLFVTFRILLISRVLLAASDDVLCGEAVHQEEF